MSYNGKSKVAKMLLYAAVTRLDGLRTKSFDGDNDKCRPFPEWYIENQLWFLNQFEQIKEYMNRYNETKETKEDIITMSQPYDIRGGKTKKKIYNNKRFLTRKSSSRVSRRHKRTSP